MYYNYANVHLDYLAQRINTASGTFLLLNVRKQQQNKLMNDSKY